MDDKNHDQPLSFREMLQSVLAAAFGVQSGKNRARDFSRGKPSHFIILGVLFTAIFVLVLYGLVKLVLHFAGV
ncbi:DUF2970 domain-containing protein [Pseudomonas sp. JS3066]|jgi:hypothetical protein|uniref:DUF2970 domain-containing protein n=1 Tax=unclassified Pseudomonas TaxID=196821 RepID=UPI000EAA845F|nr:MULTISPECIES: DUF2970 domain-containing protein [unclassified Pseudomonas]AYF86205.1 DUF2970 domain-containing protein [Pseudomonas sp. DY-1]MDH4654142.1 DUF2970 domain-containing protein [Pseudomonas sp. BN606]MRK19266.1 DUF2970 domain-containing protein [Pseudomonas sp. JG-B]WVK91205.1 DUF2970 domain-containing protein [Pseudomonas sp. JS3066]